MARRRPGADFPHKYDTTIRVGDLITAYHKGYWRVIQITKRFVTADMTIHLQYKGRLGEEYNPLFRYELVADSEGLPVRPVRGKRRQAECDAAYCHRFDRVRAYREISELREKHDRIFTAMRLLEVE